ncbi:MAG TPA: DUF3443 family protein, partial [Polyangia bacterium]
MTTKTLIPVAVMSVLCACGGSSQRPNTCIMVDPPATAEANTIGLIVDPGPQCVGYTNGLFATVTLCVPGSTTCQTFDHLLVDTGSVGVRVLESELTLDLPVVTSTSGLPLAECTPFVDGTAWGPVRSADVKLGGELAANLPIQLIGENTYAMPRSCTGSAITDFETLAANGILGVGLYPQDCGAPCATLGANRALYYSCSSSQSCSITAVPLMQQVAHPVAAFPVDNNGTIIQLPSVPASGAPSVPGMLTFGIGTQANNGLGSATVLPLDGLYVSTTFPVGGKDTYTSYLDSGSNGLFFLDAATTKLTQCTGGLKSFYCPPMTTSLSATLSSSNGSSTTIAFSVASASKLDASAFAFSNLAGPMPISA